MAFWLRDLRNRSGLTYAQLARQTGFSTTTLQEALSGKRQPTWQVTRAIVTACGGDEEAWHTYWAQIRRAIDRDAPAGLAVSVTPPWVTPRETAAEDPVTPNKAPETDKPTNSSRRLAWIIVGGLAVIAAVAMVILLLTVLSNPQPTARTYAEEEYNKHGASTFRFLNGSGPGQPLAFKEFVRVSCKVYAPTFSSTKPDGYWYRIASSPWANHYFAVANTFLNGDPPKGPYTHNTDWKVPTCKHVPHASGL